MSTDRTVGCERHDGLLNIHAEADTCEVCMDEMKEIGQEEVDVWVLLDQLYEAGYNDRAKGRDYDPRGCVEWQAVLDALARNLK